MTIVLTLHQSSCQTHHLFQLRLIFVFPYFIAKPLCGCASPLWVRSYKPSVLDYWAECCPCSLYAIVASVGVCATTKELLCNGQAPLDVCHLPLEMCCPTAYIYIQGWEWPLLLYYHGFIVRFWGPVARSGHLIWFIRRYGNPIVGFMGE